jgi:hypothetical protein
VIVIAIFSTSIGVLLGLRYTALVLIPAELLTTASTAAYGLVTHQSVIVVLIAVLGALFLPQLGFALAIYWRKRVFGRSSTLLRAAQMAIGQGMGQLPLPQGMPEQILSLLRRLEKQQEVAVD